MNISSTLAEMESSTRLVDIALPPLPWEISTGITPTPMEPLGGEFVIKTHLKGSRLSAVGGGGRTTDVIHTGGEIQPRGAERFKFWVDSATGQYYAFQTADGHFITAYNAGGLTTNTILSTATAIGGWEMFKLLPQSPPFASFAIQTLRGFFLTAVGGGGHDSGDTIHTDAVNAAEWERFNIFRCSDLGTGSTYGIQAYGGNVYNPYLTANAGGRLSGPNALTSVGGPPFWISWTLLKQDDGTYAFQTASGGILTANGGGLAGEGFRTDTETDQIGNFEKFTLVDNGDFTAYIKTHAGTYLTATLDARATTVANVHEATRWRFPVFVL